MDEHGTTQEVLAESIGTNQPAISRWKKGHIPSGDDLLKLAKYFGVTIDFLMGEPGPLPDGGALVMHDAPGSHVSEAELQHWKARALEAERMLEELRNFLMKKG